MRFRVPQGELALALRGLRGPGTSSTASTSSGDPGLHTGAQIIVDALLGTGLDRPVDAGLRECIEAVNAGHPEGLIRRATGEVERIPAGVNFPLGLKGDVEFSSLKCELKPGDAVALFTDGVTEAMNARGRQYGDNCSGSGDSVRSGHLL